MNEYAQFVDVSRQYIADGLNAQEAFNEAIDYCMNHGILHEVFKNYRAEVLGMLLEEFDVDKYERTIRMEGRMEGRKNRRNRTTIRFDNYSAGTESDAGFEACDER